MPLVSGALDNPNISYEEEDPMAETLLTNLPLDALVPLGAGHRTEPLLQQTGYTGGLANDTGTPLFELLPEGYVPALEAKRTQVEVLGSSKEVTAYNSRAATGAQNEAKREATLFCRRGLRRLARARLAGVTVPTIPARARDTRALPALLAHAGQIVVALEQAKPALDATTGKGTAELIEAGKAVLAALRQADDVQEKTRFADLPQAVREFYAAKGALYIGLKTINEAAHELYADDPVAAARFNLRILYRRASRTEPTPA